MVLLDRKEVVEGVEERRRFWRRGVRRRKSDVWVAILGCWERCEERGWFGVEMMSDVLGNSKF